MIQPGMVKYLFWWNRDLKKTTTTKQLNNKIKESWHELHKLGEWD